MSPKDFYCPISSLEAAIDVEPEKIASVLAPKKAHEEVSFQLSPIKEDVPLSACQLNGHSAEIKDDEWLIR